MILPRSTNIGYKINVFVVSFFATNYEFPIIHKWLCNGSTVTQT